MNRLARPLAMFLLLAATSFGALAETPDCTHSGSWPVSMAFGYLLDEGVFERGSPALEKAVITRLASEKIGRDRFDDEDLYRQVHLVRFPKTSGETVDVITVSEATNVECSISDVDAYVISKRLGDYTPSGSVLREPQQQKTPKPKQK
ncbi:MAG: hypothetical protein LBU76_03740 [Azoarcus sp.]|jgi:hypothetical protein|nr:hypothetical protein [Azoarcus sp.]